MGSIGAKLRTLRKQRNHSQKTLATALGVRQSTVSRWETDKDTPGTNKINDLVKELNCSYDELYGRATAQDAGEARLLSEYRSLNSRDRKKLISIAAVMAIRE